MNDSPPEPDYSDLDWCSDCRSPIFTDTSETGCECRGFCSECGELVARDALGPIALPSGRTVQACATCRAADSDGVPHVVEEEASGAQTVRLKADPTIRETGRDWAEKLDAAAL